MHTHLTFTPDAPHLMHLQASLPDDATLSTGETPPPETTLLVAGRPTRDQLDAAAHLRALVIPFAGLPAATRDLMNEYPQVSVHNLHHNAPMTAEMAVTLLLAACKRLIPIHNAFAANDWRPRYDGLRNVHLAGGHALILGYGAIGRRVAAVLRAFEMTVSGIRRHPGDEPGVYPPEALPDLLPRVQVLVVCLPGTPATAGLIGAAELSRLPAGSVVVNVGRADVIDQHALYDALKRGHLYGAGQDVWYRYPPDVVRRADHPPAEVPFGELGNMVMSPHRAGGFGAVAVETARMDALAALIRAAHAGEPLPNRVDLSAGY
jgi:phosphoglycerate dehydrogenase-like enzyme